MTGEKFRACIYQKELTILCNQWQPGHEAQVPDHGQQKPLLPMRKMPAGGRDNPDHLTVTRPSPWENPP